jgi:hypothetical protein
MVSRCFSSLYSFRGRDKLAVLTGKGIAGCWLLLAMLAAPAGAEAPDDATPRLRSALALRLERLLASELPALRELQLDEGLGLLRVRAVAPDLPTRREAVRLLREQPGILSVTDWIVVRAAPRPDAQIEQELLHELELLGPRVSDVTARVRDGVVQLSGRVADLALRSEVDELAARVRGVRDVDNTLEVDPFAELPPLRLPEDVAWALPFDSSTVRMVRQGETVILRGKLMSHEQVERLVQAMLRQPGVARVINELQVRNPFERLPGLDRSE